MPCRRRPRPRTDGPEALIADLSAAGGTVRKTGTFPAAPPFSVSGVDLCVQGRKVRVYVYPDAPAREAAANQINPNDASRIGSSVVDWIGPHGSGSGTAFSSCTWVTRSRLRNCSHRCSVSRSLAEKAGGRWGNQSTRAEPSPGLCSMAASSEPRVPVEARRARRQRTAGPSGGSAPFPLSGARHGRHGRHGRHPRPAS